MQPTDFVEMVLAAGREIMTVYAAGDHSAEQKADGSPVTEADRRAEAVILQHLARRFPSLPVVAEEAASEGVVPEAASRFVLVDPLDGTREFVSRNGEFTVNVALIEDGVPVCGVVYAPALGELYGGGPGEAWMMRIADPLAPEPGEPVSISARSAPSRLVAVGSRSHASAEDTAFLSGFDVERFEASGSSLKFCVIARGDADIYPRFGRTMEWDTAAGDAVLRAAGGLVTTTDGAALRYAKRDRGYDADFANPHFIAYGDGALAGPVR